MTNMSTTFSVVIPTYRRPHFLVQAVDSVLGQTRPPEQVIVVLDGPQPETRAALGERDVTIVEQVNAGVATARNEGARHATQDWVCFLDDDDLWHPDRLAVTGGYLATHPECRAVNAGYLQFSASGGPLTVQGVTLEDCLRYLGAHPSFEGHDLSYLDIQGRSYEHLLERNRGVISTSTVARDVWDRCGGFPDGFRYAEDWRMFLNVARLTEWHFIPTRLSFVRLHDSNATTTDSRAGLTMMQALVDAWSDPALDDAPHRPLVEYGPDYRFHVQATLWRALVNRDFRIWLEAEGLSRRLLRRPTDHLYAHLPPPLTYRIERLRRRQSPRLGG